MEEEYLIPDFNQIEISDTPHIFDQELIQLFRGNECLRNSYIVSENTGDYLIEGILIIKENNQPIYLTRHCWNKNVSTGQYYDVTKDFVWNNQHFIDQLRQVENGSITYDYISCEEYPLSEASIRNGEISFHYSYDYLIDCFNNRN